MAQQTINDEIEALQHESNSAQKEDARAVTECDAARQEAAQL